MKKYLAVIMVVLTVFAMSITSLSPAFAAESNPIGAANISNSSANSPPASSQSSETANEKSDNSQSKTQPSPTNQSKTKRSAKAKLSATNTTSDDAPTHTHIWETKFDNKYHWQECTVCGAVQKKETHEDHGLSNNGGSKIRSYNVDGKAYQESCTCGYKSGIQVVILGSWESYKGGDMKCHWVGMENVPFTDIKQITKSEFESLKSSYYNQGAGYEWIDTDGDGYGWVFNKLAIPSDFCNKGTIESILGTEGDCGRKEAKDEYYMIARFLNKKSDQSLTAFVNWLPAKGTIPTNHLMYGYHEKYENITESQWEKLKTYFKGMTAHISSFGWTGMSVIIPSMAGGDGSQMYWLNACYDSSTGKELQPAYSSATFTSGEDFTCDLCGCHYDGLEYYRQQWFICGGSLSVERGKTLKCNGHYLEGPSGNRAFFQDTFTRDSNDNVTMTVHCTVLDGGYISYCNQSYKTIQSDSEGRPTEIETTSTVTLEKRDGVVNGDSWTYPIVTQISGTVTVNGQTKQLSSWASSGYYIPLADQVSPEAYQYVDGTTYNDYWKVTGNGTADNRSVQATVKASFYDKQLYSKNVVYAAVYDSDKKTIIPQGNGEEWVALTKGDNDVWSGELSLLTETTSNKDIYVRAKDATGNLSNFIPVKVYYLDSKPPTVTATWNTTGWTNHKTLMVTATDASGQTKVGFNTNDMPDIQKAPYNGTRVYDYTEDVYSPMTMILYAQDTAGNLSQTKVTLDKVDSTKPTIVSADEDSGSLHQSTVAVKANDMNTKLNASGSGVCQYGIAPADDPDNITWTPGTSSGTLTVTKNGSYVVYAKDNAGNVSSGKSVKVSNVKCAVAFEANGGSGSMSDLSIAIGSSGNLTTNTFTRPSYKFTGWNTQADGKGTAYADGATIKPSSDMTLYAQWEFVPCVIKIPKAVSYTEMPVGVVSTDDSYDISVNGGNMYDVAITSSTDGLTDGTATLNAIVNSAGNPLSFTGDGSLKDKVQIKGTARYAGKYKGSINYNVKVTAK